MASGRKKIGLVLARNWSGNTKGGKVGRRKTLQ
jgi:hypothetical protein